MKKLLTLFLIAITLIGECNAQKVYIPDPVFRAYLVANFPSCIAIDSLDPTCPAVLSATNVSVPGYAGSQIYDITGIQCFTSLQRLNCYNNSIVSYPPLPSTLTYFNCSGPNFPTGMLSSLPALPPLLDSLNCSYNPHLTFLPSLPGSMTYLSCLMDSLVTLPPLPPGLKLLNCSFNQLTSLPTLPNTLTTFFCHYNQLTTLPALPNTIQSIWAHNNQFTSLPALPTALSILRCNNNQLTSLPALPAGMTQLFCAGNQISVLPPLPATLATLACFSNQLTNIPSLPAPLYNLNCGNNQLSSLPPLPGNLHILICNNNYLSCLPLLPTTVNRLAACGNYLTCVPNTPVGMVWDTTYCPGSPLPICTDNNSTCYYPYISGNAYIDANNNCQFDNGEAPLANQIIQLNNSLYTITDNNGHYVANADTGMYTVNATPSAVHPLLQISCPGIPYTVHLTDSVPNTDFPVTVIAYCPWLTVDIGTSRQRVCRRNSYAVSYCNNGTIAANNAYINITFHPNTIPLSSTLPWTSVNGQTYRFDLGTVNAGACASFIITDSVSCTTPQLQTVCAKAEIFPKNNCFAPNPNWDNSDIVVGSTCGNDTVIFTVKNNGTGNMSAARSYRIYRDGQLITGNISYQLNSNDSIQVLQPSGGKSYRLEADQDTAHPGKSHPRAFMEQCGQTPYSYYYITQATQDDADDDVEIACIEALNSCDPNQKTAQPSGTTSSHFVANGDELEYTIDFQNVGNDTAYKVVVVDALDAQNLDITSVVSGAASAPYILGLSGTGVLSWTFNNINLTDTVSSEPNSHGFVKFKVKQKAGLAPGTVINNSANIFFDFNNPVLTNTSMVTVEYPQVNSLAHPVSYSSANISVYPNPFSESVTFDVTGEKFADGLTIEVRDVLGKLIRNEFNKGTKIIINRSGMESGIYMYRILSGKNSVGTGKLIVN